MIINRIAAAQAAINEIFRSCVHPDVGADDMLRARHGSLIASHALGGLLSAVVFASYFAWSGAAGLAAVVAALCFLSPLAIAWHLSRTGRLDVAHLLSSANLAALVTLAAALSGGTASFALAWLALVPLEAALSANRRVMAIATGLAIAALLGLHVATTQGMLPPPLSLPVDPAMLALVTLLGAVAYACGLVANVQEIHRQSARALEESRERYRLIAENANDLITRHDANGRTAFASLASTAILGRTPDQLVAAGLETALEPDDRERFAAAIARCHLSGLPVAEEFQIQRALAEAQPPTLETIWLEMRCQPVLVDGRVATVIAVTRDITQRRAELVEVARARDEAQRVSRAKSAFLATMTHELRTPLNAIIGFSEILHRELLIRSREPKHADYCRAIHQSGEHLLSLVKDLLDVSKIESGKFSVAEEPFALRDIARSAVETLYPLAQQKSLRIDLKLAADLPELLADRRATKQILINLVSNACKFTEAGGVITVTAEETDGTIEMVVSDTGIGIAPEHLSKIGQPFYQIETAYSRQNEGAGLGLSIVRGLAELQGGTLRIESTVGVGSRFIVTLPADDYVADETEAVAPATAASPKIIDLAEIHQQRLARSQQDSAATPDARPAARLLGHAG